MLPHVRSCLLLLAVPLAACVAALPPAPPSPLVIDVTRTGSQWQARYTMPDDAPIWAFHRSGIDAATQQPWRQQQWRILTPGVTLARIGDFDALVAGEGTVPRDVTIAFEPSAANVADDHESAFILSTGSLALFTGVFSAFPMFDAEGLHGMQSGYVQETRLNFRDTGAAVLHHGQYAEAVTKPGDADDGYVVFGPVTLRQAEYGSLVVDPGLPAWLQKEVAGFAPQVLAGYRARLGSAGDGTTTPMIVTAWKGPTEAVIGINGTAAGNTLTLGFEGSGFVQRSPSALAYAKRLIAHEAAHLWLGQMLGYATHGERWISEGGVTLMAERIVAGMDDASAEEQTDVLLSRRLALILGETAAAPPDFLAAARTACAGWLAKGGVRDAGQRLEMDAFYDCGAMFALAVEQAGAPRGEDFFDFVALLIARNPDGEVGENEWLDAAAAFGLSAQSRDLVATMLADGSSDGEAALARLLDR